MPDAPEIPVALHAPIPPGYTYREISYEEKAGVGYLNFDFYNGAMSTEQCRRLREAYLYARNRRTTKVIVLAGGADFFSNGIHLNVIEAAADQGEEQHGRACTARSTGPTCSRAGSDTSSPRS